MKTKLQFYIYHISTRDSSTEDKRIDSIFPIENLEALRLLDIISQSHNFQKGDIIDLGYGEDLTVDYISLYVNEEWSDTEGKDIPIIHKGINFLSNNHEDTKRYLKK